MVKSEFQIDCLSMVIIDQCHISDTISTCRELVSLNPHVDLIIIGFIYKLLLELYHFYIRFSKQLLNHRVEPQYTI